MSDRKKRGSKGAVVTWRLQGLASPPARRSRRNSGSSSKSAGSPLPVQVMKRSVTAKKIMPRKTLAALVSAESQPAISSAAAQPNTASSAAPQSTPNVSHFTAVLRRSSRVSPNSGKENAVHEKSQVVTKRETSKCSPSKIDILSPIPLNIPQSPTFDDREKVMSQKVRRSYSRLEMSLNGSSLLYSPTRNDDSSDTSTPHLVPKTGRKSLFGFNKLLSSEAQEEIWTLKNLSETKHTNNESTSGTIIKLSVEELDHNIPGVTLVKQKRRKPKLLQIKKSDLDDWAATMNAEFEEAEKFDLLVE
ncbi:sororin isoform X1 [Pseudophryne corroboree]|uniref:sororin isoform X1 n=2 Tax=Pseudophryne corroboree TaxID=495146 RepID=UPI0030812F03